MNAHADMFIVVKHNELNTPRGIYRSLALGYEILQDSKLPKQAPINAFYYVCKLSLRCKGTTKNAHTQVKRAIIHKKDRSIYLIHYPTLAQARLKAKCWIMDDGGVFMNYCERTGVWAAFSERSYEGIGFNEDGIV